jgi:cell division protein FtsQ
MSMQPVVTMDVRLMNGLANLLLLGLSAAALLALGLWLARLPVFDLVGITVTGDVAHTNSVTLRANVSPKLTGSFFTVDLQQTRDIFQRMPWVRKALVEREFPNRLRVHLEEHKPVAYWGAPGDERLLNSHGEIFEPNLGELDDDDLPRLMGPDNQSAQVLDTYQSMQAEFAAMGLPIAILELTARGSWRVKTQQGATIEMGRGNLADLQKRVLAFSKTLPGVAQKWGRQVSALEMADLRHDGGYALRLRGVTIGDAAKAVR